MCVYTYIYTHTCRYMCVYIHVCVYILRPSVVQIAGGSFSVWFSFLVGWFVFYLFVLFLLLRRNFDILNYSPYKKGIILAFNQIFSVL